MVELNYLMNRKEDHASRLCGNHMHAPWRDCSLLHIPENACAYGTPRYKSLSM